MDQPLTTTSVRPSLQLLAGFRRAISGGGRFWGLSGVFAVIWSIAQVGIFQKDLINHGGWPQVVQFFRAALRPEVSAAFIGIVLDASLVTVAYALCGLGVSLVIGTVGGLLSSEVWWHSISRSGRVARGPWILVRASLSLPRAIHEIVWGLFFVNIFGLDPLGALLALGIPFGAITAKVFSEILDETPRAPLYALLSSGASPLSAFLYSIIPQALPNLLSYVFYRFECAIRSAAVLGLIGAGGIGYQLFLSLQSLRYVEAWTLIYALCLLSGLTDLWGVWLRSLLGSGASCADPGIRIRTIPAQTGTSHIGAVQPRGQTASSQLNPAGITLLAMLILTPLAYVYLGIDARRLTDARTLPLLTAVAQEAWPPDATLNTLRVLLPQVQQTLAISILAMAGAGLLGFATAHIAARNLVRTGDSTSRLYLVLHSAVIAGTRALLLLWRALPAPMWAMLFLFVSYPGILPGALALSLHNGGILGRLIGEAVENADERPLRALQALGAPTAHAILYGILPRTTPQALAYTLYRWEVCMRDTVIVGLVGAGGLGRLMQEQLSSFDYPAVLTSLFAMFVLTFLADAVSALARRTLR